MKRIKSFEDFIGIAESFVNEGSYIHQQELRDIHFETDPEKQETLKLAFGKSLGGITKKERLEDANYALTKFRKEIKYEDKEDYTGVFQPGSHSAEMSTLGNGPHSKNIKVKSWNNKEYYKWIKAMSGNGGAENAFDMAQNAKNEPGLIDWVKKNNRGDDPLQIIQWDIEAYA